MAKFNSLNKLFSRMSANMIAGIVSIVLFLVASVSGVLFVAITHLADKETKRIYHAISPALHENLVSLDETEIDNLLASLTENYFIAAVRLEEHALRNGKSTLYGEIPVSILPLHVIPFKIYDPRSGLEGRIHIYSDVAVIQNVLVTILFFLTAMFVLFTLTLYSFFSRSVKDHFIIPIEEIAEWLRGNSSEGIENLEKREDEIGYIYKELIRLKNVSISQIAVIDYSLREKREFFERHKKAIVDNSSEYAYYHIGLSNAEVIVQRCEELLSSINTCKKMISEKSEQRGLPIEVQYFLDAFDVNTANVYEEITSIRDDIDYWLMLAGKKRAKNDAKMEVSDIARVVKYLLDAYLFNKNVGLNVIYRRPFIVDEQWNALLNIIVLGIVYCIENIDRPERSRIEIILDVNHDNDLEVMFKIHDNQGDFVLPLSVDDVDVDPLNKTGHIILALESVLENYFNSDIYLEVESESFFFKTILPGDLLKLRLIN